jgi:hypothetical protein
MSHHHAKAKHHHGQIAKALESKDYPAAMSHTGHLLSALKSAHKAPLAPTLAPIEDGGYEAANTGAANKHASGPPAAFGGIRERMAAMKKG